MKKNQFRSLIGVCGKAAFAALTMAFVSCSEETEERVTPVSVNHEQQVIVAPALTGNWEVTYFSKEEDKTFEFTDVTLSFNADGSVTAKKGEEKVDGHWSIRPSSNEQQLVLDFGTKEPFEDLNNDRVILERTEGRLSLKTKGSGDFLTLERK